MFRSSPIAYLLTWTCYGTWLHGDERGSVDEQHKNYRTAFVSTDAKREQLDRDKLTRTPPLLDASARRIVEATIRRHVAIREWTLHAVNVRTNHVHVVVSCGDTHTEKAMAEMKAWTTRRLREAGCVSADATVWTHHGSKRYLWNEASLAKAVEYVSEKQGVDLA